MVERYLDCAIKPCTVEISLETPEILELSESGERISDITEDSDVILRAGVKKTLRKPLPFCLPGFRRKEQKRHLQKAFTLDDSLDTILLLILAWVNLGKLFNINNIRE